MAVLSDGPGDVTPFPTRSLRSGLTERSRTVSGLILGLSPSPIQADARGSIDLTSITPVK